MNSNDPSEKVLAARPLVLWAWFLLRLLSERLDPAPVAAYLSFACLLFAAARWSKTVRRSSWAALLLLDAPAIFTIQLHDGWPSPLAAAALSGLLFAAVLYAGVATLSRAVVSVLGLQLFALEAVLLARAGDGALELATAGAIIALAGWAVRDGRPGASSTE